MQNYPLTSAKGTIWRLVEETPHSFDRSQRRTHTRPTDGVESTKRRGHTREHWWQSLFRVGLLVFTIQLWRFSLFSFVLRANATGALRGAVFVCDGVGADLREGGEISWARCATKTATPNAWKERKKNRRRPRSHNNTHTTSQQQPERRTAIFVRLRNEHGTPNTTHTSTHTHI